MKTKTSHSSSPSIPGASLMTDAVFGFPVTSAAVAALAAIHDGWHHEEPYQTALAAYADELLPEILSGEWTLSKAWIGKLFNTQFKRPLFDHAHVYRRKGRRGPANWSNSVAIGQPYDIFNAEGQHTGNADQLAQQLNESGVVVWVRRDLSAWYPGRTALVLASPYLKFRTAADHGFDVLGASCPEAPEAKSHARRRQSP